MGLTAPGCILAWSGAIFRGVLMMLLETVLLKPKGFTALLTRFFYLRKLHSLGFAFGPTLIGLHSNILTTYFSQRHAAPAAHGFVMTVYSDYRYVMP